MGGLDLLGEELLESLQEALGVLAHDTADHTLQSLVPRLRLSLYGKAVQYEHKGW